MKNKELIVQKINVLSNSKINKIIFNLLVVYKNLRFWFIILNKIQNIFS